MSRVLTSILITTPRHSAPARIAKPRLVLRIERLRRRDQAPNSARVASLLGGGSWLARAWKRIERNAVLKRLCRVFNTDVRRPGNPLRLGIVYPRRMDVFHAPCMAFRF